MYRYFFPVLLLFADTLEAQTPDTKFPIRESNVYDKANPIATDRADSTLYFYDAQDRLESTLTLAPDTNEVWKPSYRTLGYTYDAQNNRTGYWRQSATQSGWSDIRREMYKYNALNQLTNDTLLIKNASSAVWDTVLVSSYEYFGSGKIRNKYWKSNGQERKAQYTYSSSGQLTKVTGLIKNSVIYQIENVSTYTYNSLADLHPASVDTESPNGIKGHVDYTYDANGNLLESLGESTWDGVLLSKSRYVYTYDAQQRRKTQTTYFDTNGGWYLAEKIRYEYNEAQLHRVEITETLAPGGFDVHTRRIYFRALSDTFAPEPLEAQVYPNPATDKITLEGKNLAVATLFDANGRVQRRVNLLEQDLPQVDVKGLDSGVFFLMIMDVAGKSKVEKVLVSH